MKDEIRHDGIIIAIDGDLLRVRIVQVAACLHCKIASHCNSADSKEKIVDVKVSDPSNYAVGQEIVLTMGGKLGLKAVLLAFVIPVVLALVVIGATIAATSSDGLYPMDEISSQGMGAGAGLLIFVVYYTGLTFFRDSLKEQFQFRIL